MIYSKNLYYSLAIGIVLLGALSFRYFQSHNQTIYTESKFIADFSDIRKVVGFSDNVFEGLIVKSIGTAPVEDGGIQHPQTLYTIKILKNIKGNLSGDITLIQEGGYDENKNLIIEAGTSLLQEGNTYILTTKGDNPYRLLNHKNGYHLISNGGKADGSTYVKLKDFSNAYKNELLYEGDMKISSGKNNYKDISIEDSKKLEEKLFDE